MQRWHRQECLCHLNLMCNPLAGFQHQVELEVIQAVLQADGVRFGVFEPREVPAELGDFVQAVLAGFFERWRLIDPLALAKDRYEQVPGLQVRRERNRGFIMVGKDRPSIFRRFGVVIDRVRHETGVIKEPADLLNTGVRGFDDLFRELDPVMPGTGFVGRRIDVPHRADFVDAA
jgi:hypothetical protein